MLAAQQQGEFSVPQDFGGAGLNVLQRRLGTAEAELQVAAVEYGAVRQVRVLIGAVGFQSEALMTHGGGPEPRAGPESCGGAMSWWATGASISSASAAATGRSSGLDGLQRRLGAAEAELQVAAVKHGAVRQVRVLIGAVGRHELVGDGRIHQFCIRSGDREEFRFAAAHTEMHPFGFDGRAVQDHTGSLIIAVTADKILNIRFQHGLSLHFPQHLLQKRGQTEGAHMESGGIVARVQVQLPPRFRVQVVGGMVFGAYDLIIVDSTDPFGPSEGLFTREFYGSCHNALREDGIMVNQQGSPFYAEDAGAMQGFQSEALMTHGGGPEPRAGPEAGGGVEGRAVQNHTGLLVIAVTADKSLNIQFIRRQEGAYDLIIVDSTDPFGPSEGLFTREFYGSCCS